MEKNKKTDAIDIQIAAATKVLNKEKKEEVEKSLPRTAILKGRHSCFGHFLEFYIECEMCGAAHDCEKEIGSKSFFYGRQA
jgi:hypothetical protein